MWLARDRHTGFLWSYPDKPIRNESEGWFFSINISDAEKILNDNRPDITWDNSPVEV